MMQVDNSLSLWDAQYPVTDEQANAARLVIAGAAQDTEDARLLMQACGLIHDPLADRFIVMPSGHVKRGPNAKRVGSQT